MQARFATFSAIALVLAAASPAAAQTLTHPGACPEQPVCAHCGADINDNAEDPNATAHGGAEAAQDVFVTEAAVGGATGGVWKTSNGGATQTAPSDVQTAPSANMPIFLELDGVPGEGSEAPSSPPPPPPPPPPPRPPSGGGTIPMEEFSLNFEEIKVSSENGGQDVAAPQEGQAGLLLPAVQRVRESAARAGDPQMDGVVVLNQEEEQAAGTGTLTLTNGSQAVVPELPVCGSCSADVPTQAQQQEPEQRERPRRNFSITIGGVTVGTGGVNVAVGDVTGDGSGESRSATPSRASSARRR